MDNLEKQNLIPKFVDENIYLDIESEINKNQKWLNMKRSHGRTVTVKDILCCSVNCSDLFERYYSFEIA